MRLYDELAPNHARPHQEPFLDTYTVQRLWGLFVAIGRFWNNDDGEPEGMRSRWLVFLLNRIHVRPDYLHEYRNAAAVLDELIAEHGDPGGYEKLLTDPAASINPPRTRIARARQNVSNEFIELQLALGGFAAFGAMNYLGYISGANIASDVPYRPYGGPAR